MIYIISLPPGKVLEVVPLWQRQQLRVLLNSEACLPFLLTQLLWVIWGWSVGTPHSRPVVLADEKKPGSHNGYSHPEKQDMLISLLPSGD